MFFRKKPCLSPEQLSVVNQLVREAKDKRLADMKSTIKAHRIETSTTVGILMIKP